MPRHHRLADNDGATVHQLVKLLEPGLDHELRVAAFPAVSGERTRVSPTGRADHRIADV